MQGSPAQSTADHAPRAPLFVRLVALFLAVALVPVGAVSFATLEVNRDALAHLSRQLHLSVVSDAVRALRSDIGAVREELSAVEHLLLAPGLGDDERRLALAGARVTASERIDFVTLYAADGRRLGTLKAEEAPEPPAPELLAKPLQDEAIAHGQAIGHVVPGRAGPALELVVPVRLDDEVKGFLYAAVPLAPIGQVLGDIAERRLGRRDRVFVVDADRTLVAASDPARVLAHESLQGQGIFAAVDGHTSFRTAFGTTPEFSDGTREMLGALETVPELGFAAIAVQPLDDAYAPLAALRRTLLLALAAAILLSLVGGLVAARTVNRPVAALVRATVELASRTFRALPSDVEKRGDELGSLARSFVQMAGELERSERKLLHEARVRDSLSRYLPGRVVDLIVSDPGRLRLAGERREVTVLFADVVGFTRLSESLPPEQIVALLNELFTVATEIVQKRGGLVDKFIGDAVMAVWGTPEAHPEDPLNAVLAAEDLRRWTEALNRKFRRTHGVEVQLAFGIATGPVVAGNVGSEKRLDYTVVGDTVNVAASLERLAAPGQILVSEATRARVGARLELREAGEKRLHGRASAATVFEVLE